MNDTDKIRICGLRRGKVILPTKSETKQQEKRTIRKNQAEIRRKKLRKLKQRRKDSYKKIEEERKIVKQFMNNVIKNLKKLR